MKILSLFILCTFCYCCAFTQDSSRTNSLINKQAKVDTVDAACGTCIFKMKGTTCELAIKWKKQYYFVEGTNIDDHGDAHANDGFCNAAKKAVVQGKIKNGKFVVQYFKLVNEKKRQ